jgi:hypothetical protein
MHRISDVCGKEIRVEGRWLRIARLEADKYLFLDDPEAALARLRTCGTRIDLFTFLPRLSEVSIRYSYPVVWDNLAVLPITSFDQWWTKEIGFKARNKAKQAEKKGAVIREVPFDRTLVQGISAIYNESPVRQGRRFPHYGKDLDRIYREEATFLDNSVFAGAFLGDTLIGFTKLVYDDARTQAGLMNIVSMIGHRDKAPTNALIAQAVRSCAERGISHLVYSNFAYGRKHRSSLSDFKERNGFRRVDLPRFYVPLTRTGAAALKLGLHRRLVEHLPEPVAARLRDLRSAWYSRRFASPAEAL